MLWRMPSMLYFVCFIALIMAYLRAVLSIIVTALLPITLLFIITAMFKLFALFLIITKVISSISCLSQEVFNKTCLWFFEGKYPCVFGTRNLFPSITVFILLQPRIFFQHSQQEDLYNFDKKPYLQSMSLSVVSYDQSGF